MQPFFSIIIPTLNEERFLPLLLASLSRQTFNQFETIVVDGRSDDQTVNRARGFASRLPEFTILSSHKRNVSHQRNLGARKARGKYLLFFDADVEAPKNYLFQLQRYLGSDHLPIATTWLRSKSKQPEDRLFYFLNNIAIEISALINRPFAPGYNTIVKKELFASLHGFDERLKISEDHEFADRAFQRGYHITIFKTPKLIVSNRRLKHEGTLTILAKYSYSALYYLLKGPITEDLYFYPMGGHVYQKRLTRGMRIRQLLRLFDRSYPHQLVREFRPEMINKFLDKIKSL